MSREERMATFPKLEFDPNFVPQNWKAQWNGIAEMRNMRIAPVDIMGP